MPTNRIDPTAPPSPYPGTPDPVSPTGKPVLPVAVVPVLTAVVSLAAVGAQFLPGNTVFAHVCHAVLGFAAVFGIVSPGLRSKS